MRLGDALEALWESGIPIRRSAWPPEQTLVLDEHGKIIGARDGDHWEYGLAWWEFDALDWELLTRR